MNWHQVPPLEYGKIDLPGEPCKTQKMPASMSWQAFDNGRAVGRNGNTRKTLLPQCLEAIYGLQGIKLRHGDTSRPSQLTNQACASGVSDSNASIPFQAGSQCKSSELTESATFRHLYLSLATWSLPPKSVSNQTCAELEASGLETCFITSRTSTVGTSTIFSFGRKCRY